MLEGRVTLGGFGFLSHAGPDIGVDEIGIAEGGGGIGRLGDLGLWAMGLELFEPGILKEVAIDAEESKSHAGEAGGEGERAADVIGISDVGDLFADAGVDRFLHGHEIGEGLAGVSCIGEPVDDGECVVAGEFIDGGVSEGAGHHEIAVFGENANEVFGAFASLPAYIAAKVDGGATELCHAGFKADAGSEAWLFEEEGESALSKPGGAEAFMKIGFDTMRQREDVVEFVGG